MKYDESRTQTKERTHSLTSEGKQIARLQKFQKVERDLQRSEMLGKKQDDPLTAYYINSNK